MASKTAEQEKRNRASVTTMTFNSRKFGAVGGLAAIAGIAMACGSPSATDDASAQEPPTVMDGEGGEGEGGGGDAAAEADAAPRYEEDARPLCTLTGAPRARPGDVLVYSEDFDGSALDTTKWRIADSYRGHDAIANTSSPKNALLSDGTLKIVSERNETDTEHPYVSGLVETLGKFARTYGKIEFRARFPYAAGIWYAIWGRPWSQPFPEIDLEVVNRPTKSKTEVYFVNHWAAPPLPADERRSFAMTDKIDASVFHTYTLLWKPGSLEWQIDGVRAMQAQPQGVPDLPVYWIINGWVGGWPGAPNETTPFPTTFEVDYMHVYRVDGVVADPVIKILNPKPTFKSSEKVEVALANFDEVCAHVEMYDGDKLVRTSSDAPFILPLKGFSSGTHTISFVAKDGDRSTKATFETEID